MSDPDEPRPSVDTAELVGASSRGDVQATDLLLQRFLPEVIAYVRRNAGEAIVAHESATDIAHSACREVLTRLVEQRHVYTDEAHFRAWLFQAALRKIQDRARHWRRDKRDPQRLSPLAGHEDQLLEGIAQALTPSEHMIAAEDRLRLAGALDQLDARQREVVRMAYEEHLSHRDIAAKLQIEESHSRTLLARALAKLARLVAD